MRAGWGDEGGDCRFDLPPRFASTERRMAGLAIAMWKAGGREALAGFASNSIYLTDRGGCVVVGRVGVAVAAAFGLVAGMRLTKRAGLAAELTAACDLIALDPVPVPFEASLSGPALLLVRGVALPLFDNCRETGEVQIVINWREVLNRAATSRLQREMGAALPARRRISSKIDPFAPRSIG